MSNSNPEINEQMNFSQKIFFRLLNRIKYGQITLFDQNKSYVFQGKDVSGSDPVTLSIKDKQTYNDILFKGSIGAGKSYIDGHWETNNLNRLLEIFMENSELFNAIESPFAKWLIFFRGIFNKLLPNNVDRAKKNILAHYDLSNDFFQLILDSSLMYSCALYETENSTLEEAAKHKLQSICDQLQINANDHVLEIGTGWGGFAIYAASKYGCRVTTTTISDKQYKYVKSEIARLGLEDRIELLNIDYRELKGSYDKLVSIEMIEAVGYKYFATYFNQCNRLLKTGGLLFLQAIVINDQVYDAAKDEIDFIKKYIFPGGCLPSVNVISNAIATQTQMQLISLRDIGKHYVHTLKDWQQRLSANRNAIIKLGFTDEFIRMWEFYFAYCIAGFQTAYISDIHAIWRKRK